MEQNKRNSFVLYFDYSKHISLLSDQEAGKLFKALFQFGEHGTIPDFSGSLLMCFSFISSQMQRDKEKYIDICEKRAKAGRKGGKQKQANLANVNSVKQKQANLADNDTDNDNVNDTDTEKKNNTVNEVYSKGFEEFWKSYPRKVGKSEAYKKYRARLNDGWSEAELLEAAKNYAGRVARERTEQKYIKHAKTFLSENTPFTDFLPNEKDAEKISSDDADDPYGEWRQ